MKRGTDCWGHVHTADVPLEDHHILPKEYGGPTTPANMRRVCSNFHGDVHYFIALLLKYDAVVPWETARTFSTKCRALARLGYAQVIVKLPPHQLADVRRREIVYTLEEAA